MLTPSGEAATTLHVGPYDRLGEAHAAIDRWRAEHGREYAGVSWETYGDWNDDPTQLTTRVSYLLA
jgi:effector-binding domain-containing protein